MTAASTSNDLPAWLARVSPHGRTIIAEVLRRYGSTTLDDAFREVPPPPAPAALRNTQETAPEQDAADAPAAAAVTRQARHAKYARARTTATAGAMLEALADDDIRRFVLSAEFATLRPYTADALSKWTYLLPLAPCLSQAACERLFEAGAELFLALGGRLGALPPLEVLRILNAIVAMGAGPVLFGSAFRAPLSDIARDAARRGLFNNRMLRVRIANLQSWAGDDVAQLELLLEPTLVRTGLGDAYLYVRNDTRTEVFELSTELLRKGMIEPERCLLKSRPEATILQLLDFTLTRLRDVQRLRTPGYMLLMLSAVHNARAHALELHARGLLRTGLNTVQQRLERFERVQLMEKRRFYELFERMPEGLAKRRMSELWNRDPRLSASEVVYNPEPAAAPRAALRTARAARG